MRPGYPAFPPPHTASDALLIPSLGSDRLIQALSAVPWHEETSDDEAGEQAGLTRSSSKGKGKVALAEQRPKGQCAFYHSIRESC